MNESHIMGWIASALQFMVAGYALRLNRRFGTARVGWSLFGAFSLLALLQLVQSATLFDAGANSALKINVTYVLISFLLLIGMVHLEAMLKERLRVERLEKRLRADLESEVKSKTAHLNRAIEELMSEIDETKRMAAIIESAEWTTIGKTADELAAGEIPAATTALDHLNQESVREPAPMRFAPGRDDEDEEAMAGITSGEWAAHF